MGESQYVANVTPRDFTLTFLFQLFIFLMLLLDTGKQSVYPK